MEEKILPSNVAEELADNAYKCSTRFTIEVAKGLYKLIMVAFLWLLIISGLIIYLILK